MDTQVLLSLIGVVLGIALVMLLSFQGVSALFSAVAAAAIMLLFSGLDVQNGVLKEYAAGLANQVSSVLMMFVCGGYECDELYAERGGIYFQLFRCKVQLYCTDDHWYPASSRRTEYRYLSHHV